MYPTNLDELPLWDPCLESVADPSDETLWVPVQSRRGCPNDCSYCSTASVQGRTIRARSPELVVRQIGRLAEAGYRRFFFVDNSFNIPEAHGLALCRELAALRTRVQWRCILYPHRLQEDFVRAMAEAGCVEVSLGFESGSPSVLREMNKRYQPEDVRYAVELLRRYGVRVFGFLLFGGPGETPDTVEESLAFAKSLDLQMMRVTVGIRIYPGTALARRAVVDGIIAADDELLEPRFYLAPGLEPWIHERLTTA